MKKGPVSQKRVRVAGYVRVSSQRQATEGDSLECQENEIRKYVDAQVTLHGWVAERVGNYIDSGKSAKDQNRPQLQRLKRDIAAGKVDLVVTFKLDRLTRSLLDFVELWKLFDDHGVRVVSLRENFDTSGPMGEAMLKLIMVFAELERKLTAERTAAIMLDRAERGEWNGGILRGYRPDPDNPGKLTVAPEEAAVIQSNFFDAFEKLGSAGAVQRELRKSGVWVPEWKSRGGKVHLSRPYAKQQVIRILRNPIFIGRIEYGGLSKDGCHEPIITKQQFDRVQRLLDETTKKRRSHRHSRGRGYPLRGLVRCGCGAMMTPKGAVAKGKSFRYYECTRQIHGGRAACSAARIPAKALEEAVVARLRTMGTSHAARERVVQEAVKLLEDGERQNDSAMAAVRNRLGAVQGEIRNLIGALTQLGEKGVASVKQELEVRQEEKEQLTEQLAALRADREPAESAMAEAKKFVATFEKIGDLFDQATPDELRILLQHYVQGLELKFSSSEGKAGSYALHLFPEVGNLPDPKASEPPADGVGRGLVLTAPALFRNVDEKAPRVGFEPTTNRLTAGCSTVELSGNRSAEAAASRKVFIRYSRLDCKAFAARDPIGFGQTLLYQLWGDCRAISDDSDGGGAAGGGV